jgi:hypothetical protein
MFSIWSEEYELLLSLLLILSMVICLENSYLYSRPPLFLPSCFPTSFRPLFSFAEIPTLPVLFYLLSNQNTFENLVMTMSLISTRNSTIPSIIN